MQGALGPLPHTAKIRRSIANTKHAQALEIRPESPDALINVKRSNAPQRLGVEISQIQNIKKHEKLSPLLLQQIPIVGLRRLTFNVASKAANSKRQKPDYEQPLD